MRRFILSHKYFLIFLLVLTVSLYLRFYHAESEIFFGWDQTRDSWKVRDIIRGELVLHGPKTGIGNLHLGPLYFYFLVPFYLFTHLDPVGSIYFTFVANIINFVSLFFVTRKIFSEKAALFAVFIYGFSDYLIVKSQSPWNVSLVPAATVFIFYAIWKIYKGDNRWFLALGALTGFFYHLHFTAIFLPFIIASSLIFLKNKKRAIPWIVGSILCAFVFLIPILLWELLKTAGEQQRVVSFLDDYAHKPTPQFLLYRLPDTLVQFQTILFFPFLSFLKYMLPIIFACVLYFFEKDKERRLLGYLFLPWFLIPLLGFTFYGGPISDYYFLITAPFVIFILIYLQTKLLSINAKYFLIPLFIFWTVYAFYNTRSHWIKVKNDGLAKQKVETREKIQKGEVLEYNEGDIKTYLYEIWVKDKMPTSR